MSCCLQRTVLCYFVKTNIVFYLGLLKPDIPRNADAIRAIARMYSGLDSSLERMVNVAINQIITIVIAIHGYFIMYKKLFLKSYFL